MNDATHAKEQAASAAAGEATQATVAWPTWDELWPGEWRNGLTNQ